MQFLPFLMDMLIHYSAEIDTQVHFAVGWKTSQNAFNFTPHSMKVRNVVGRAIRKPYKESVSGDFSQTFYQARHSLDCLVLKFFKKYF